MPRRSRFFVLKVNPRDFAARLTRTRAVYDSRSRETIDKVANFTVKVMKSFTPVRTGRLRDSIQVQKKRTTKGATDLRHSIEVGSPLHYFTFIDRGTKSSPGRFVPFIGKKLTTIRPGFGFHPGVQAQHIIDKTQAKVRELTDVELTKMLRSWVKSDWGRIK